jgi:hypothetical protein
MQLPFTSDQFYGVFREYNETIWPAQFLLVALALVAVGLALRPRRWSGIAVSAILAFYWAWIAVAYHLAFFTVINPAAYVFAAVSAAGATVLLWQGVFRRRLQFRWTGGPRSYGGAALIVFALVIYPAWLFYSGHTYPATATFGLPCPTTIFTIGLLAFAVPSNPRGPLVVPVLWCFNGAQAAVLLDVAPDLGLVVAAVVGIGLMVRSKTPVAADKASVRVDAQAATKARP